MYYIYNHQSQRKKLGKHIYFNESLRKSICQNNYFAFQLNLHFHLCLSGQQHKQIVSHETRYNFLFFYLIFKFVIYEKLTSFFLLWQIQFEFECIMVLALWRQYENWTEYYFNILNEAKCLELEFPWWRARERFREK